jgi:hypothetical protein
MTLTSRHTLQFRRAANRRLDYVGHFVRLRQHHNMAGKKHSGRRNFSALSVCVFFTDHPLPYIGSAMDELDPTFLARI